MWQAPALSARREPAGWSCADRVQGSEAPSASPTDWGSARSRVRRPYGPRDSSIVLVCASYKVRMKNMRPQSVPISPCEQALLKTDAGTEERDRLTQLSY